MTTLAHAVRVAVQGSSSQLHEDDAGWRAVFDAQPAAVQQYAAAQGRLVAAALMERARHVQFTLPERVVASAGAAQEAVLTPVPPAFRTQRIGHSLVDRLSGVLLEAALLRRFADLEHAEDAALAVSAGLVRYAAAMHLLRDLVPAGKPVVYGLAEEDGIPSIPVETGAESGTSPEAAHAAAADCFYLPQWAPFDARGRLLADSLESAELQVAALTHSLQCLDKAIVLAPYLLANHEYQQKRYGLLGQLVFQSRALAHCKLGELIRIVRERAAAADLLRGLSLSVPYFDDQTLSLRMYDFEVIPPGRVPFVPAFVVRAARVEQGKVAQDMRLSAASRTYLLAELKRLERAFEPQAGARPDGRRGPA